MSNQLRTLVTAQQVTDVTPYIGQNIGGFGKCDRLVFLLSGVSIATVGTLSIYLSDRPDGATGLYLRPVAGFGSPPALFTVTNNAASQRQALWVGNTTWGAWADEIQIQASASGAGADYTFSLSVYSPTIN